MATTRRTTALLCFLLAPVIYAQNPPVPSPAINIRNDLFGFRLDEPIWQSDTALSAAVRAGGGGQKKSVGLAAIYSLLLPGMGELYAGGFGSGKFYLGAEAILWLTYTAFDVYGNSLRDDARAYAVEHAGLNPAGKSDQYYVDVGNFLTINDYNEKKLRDRNLSAVYDASYAWQWDSDASRATFKDQRIASENAYNNRKFIIGAVLINHIASAINAARAAITHNKEMQGGVGDLQFGASVLGGWGHPHGILVTVAKGL